MTTAKINLMNFAYEFEPVDFPDKYFILVAKCIQTFAIIYT